MKDPGFTPVPGILEGDRYRFTSPDSLQIAGLTTRPGFSAELVSMSAPEIGISDILLSHRAEDFASHRPHLMGLADYPHLTAGQVVWLVVRLGSGGDDIAPTLLMTQAMIMNCRGCGKAVRRGESHGGHQVPGAPYSCVNPFDYDKYVGGVTDRSEPTR